MRDNARSSFTGSSATPRGPIGAAIAAVVAITALALLSAGSAMAASVAPTITSAFTPTEIGVGDSTATALSFTITNPNASASLTGVSFTDTLPAGLAVDNPNGENGSCGTGSVVTANPASQTIFLTGGTLKKAASCTVSVSLVASQAGVLQNSTGPVSSSAGSSATGDTESLTVLPPPTVTVSKIKQNAKYAYGAVVKPTFSCAQAGDPTALADCSAADDLGNNVNSGGALKTKVPGKHTLTVTASSTDGLSTSDEIDYTVLPDNVFTITAVKHGHAGALSFALGLPGAGKVKAVELTGHHVTFGKFAGSVGRKRTLKETIKPTPAGKALIQTKATKITLEVTFTPQGGVSKTVTKRGITVTSG